MACPMCQTENGKLYHFPLEKWVGRFPIATVCYFCYLKLTRDRPERSALVLPV
jgi:hypothetical protein